MPDDLVPANYQTPSDPRDWETLCDEAIAAARDVIDDDELADRVTENILAVFRRERMPRGHDAIMADAIRILTEAARLRRRVMRPAESGGWEPHPYETEPADWAEFVTLAMTAAAANIGSIERALEGRPGSWEAAKVRDIIVATAGENQAGLIQHRTEPLQVTLRPAELLWDLGYGGLYDDSRRILEAEQDRHLWRYRLEEDRTWTALDDGSPAWADAFDVPASEVDTTLLSPGAVMTVPRSGPDEAAYDVLLDLEAALEDLEHEHDPRAYGEALEATVLAEAAQMYPGVPVEVTVDTGDRMSRDDSPYWGETPEEALADAAFGKTPLPWSGIAPHDYPAGQTVADAERAAGRLPHLRLAHDAPRAEAPETEPGDA